MNTDGCGTSTPALHPADLKTSDAVANRRNVRLAEAIRLRLEGWMRGPIERHAALLAQAAKHRISVAGSIRDLLSRALRGQGPTEAYLAGYGQGFLAGYSDGKQEGCGRIRPHRSDDNDNYHPDGEGNG